jgi:hypothetical protein
MKRPFVDSFPAKAPWVSEALDCAHQLAAEIDGTVSAAVVGEDLGALADELARKKLYKAYAINHNLLKVPI